MEMERSEFDSSTFLQEAVQVYNTEGLGNFWHAQCYFMGAFLARTTLFYGRMRISGTCVWKRNPTSLIGASLREPHLESTMGMASEVDFFQEAIQVCKVHVTEWWHQFLGRRPTSSFYGHNSVASEGHVVYLSWNNCPRGGFHL